MTASTATSTMAAGVPVLMYHAVPATPAHCRTPLDISRGAFAEQLDALAAAGWQVTGLTEAVARTARGEQHVAALTLDDAYADVAGAVEELDARGMRATVYVPTDFPDEPHDAQTFPHPVLSWAGLRDLAAAGVELGSHSCSHRPLDVLPDDRLRHELADSREHLAERTGVLAQSLCYPYGYTSGRVVRVAAQVGYATACTVGRRIARAGDHLLRIPRLQPLPTMTAAQVVDLLTHGEAGLLPKVKPALQPAWRGVRRVAGRLGVNLT